MFVMRVTVEERTWDHSNIKGSPSEEQNVIRKQNSHCDIRLCNILYNSTHFILLGAVEGKVKVHKYH